MVKPSGSRRRTQVPSEDGPTRLRRAIPSPWNASNEWNGPPTLPCAPFAQTSDATARQRPSAQAGPDSGEDALGDFYAIIRRAAQLSCEVLIRGESSAGRLHLARAIHAKNAERSGDFVAIHCSHFARGDLEAELFGRAQSAFTRTPLTRRGRIALAEGGTLFIDDVELLPVGAQIKVLRLLQVREYSPLGCATTFTSNARVLVGTSARLDEAVRAGTFLRDLYERVRVFRLGAPPPRNESGQVLISASDRTPSSDSGGVAELAPVDFSVELPEEGTDLRSALLAFEEELIRQALRRTAGSRARAAQLLGIPRTTLVAILKRRRITAA